MTTTKKQLIEELRVITNEYITDKGEWRDTDWIIERLREILKKYNLKYMSDIIFIRYARQQLDGLYETCLWYTKERQTKLHKQIDEFLAWFTNKLKD